MSVISQKKNPAGDNGFFNPYSKYDKIIEKGMEKYFYGRETKGPGAYLPTDVIVASSVHKKGENFSIPKSNRGLLPNTNPVSHSNTSRKWSPVPGQSPSQTALSMSERRSTLGVPVVMSKTPA